MRNDEFSDTLVDRVKARAEQQGGRRGLRRKPPKWQNPDSVERQYRAILLGFIDTMRQRVQDIVIANLPPIIEAARAELPNNDRRADAWPDDLDKLIQRLRLDLEQRIESREFSPQLRNIAKRVAEFNKSQFRRITEATLGVNITLQEPYLASRISSFEKQNLGLIKKLTEDQIGDIEGVAQRSVQSGRRIEDVTKSILGRVDVAESRAKLIARDQVQKLNSNLTQLRQEEAGVDRYVWRTSRDERVRDSHKANGGKTFSWNDPPSGTGHPGEDVNCRCYAEPVLEDVFERAGV